MDSWTGEQILREKRDEYARYPTLVMQGHMPLARAAAPQQIARNVALTKCAKNVLQCALALAQPDDRHKTPVAVRAACRLSQSLQ